MTEFVGKSKIWTIIKNGFFFFENCICELFLENLYELDVSQNFLDLFYESE